jgi:hypothetical protein
MRINVNRRIVARAMLATTGVLAAVSVAACNGTATGSLSANNSPATAQSSSAVQTTVADAPTQPFTSPIDTSPIDTGPAAPASGTPTAAASHPTVTGATTPGTCRSSQLKLSFGGGDAGMSQQERVLRFTNASRTSCTIVGFPGVSYVAGDNGAQVGAAAVREGHIGARITLAPGQVASTVIHSVDVGVFDPSVCKPTPVRGYRVYPPNNTAAMFIPLPSGVRGCAGNPPDPQLGVYSVKRGPGNPDQP